MKLQFRMWILTIVFAFFIGGCGAGGGNGAGSGNNSDNSSSNNGSSNSGGGSAGEDNSSSKAITAYSLAGVAGAINETAKSITITMPFGTNVSDLVATFTTTGVSVNVEENIQTSGQTTNDFTNPVVYRVTAADGSTADYTVTVTVAISSAKAITAYSLAGVEGVINETTKSISVTMPFGTNVTALVATFTTTGLSVNVGENVQTSGQTTNDFTNPVVYRVTAADGSTADYTVTVTVAISSAKAITAYSLAGVEGVINETTKSISVTMPFGTNVTTLVATFTTTGLRVKVGETLQISGQTANDFTNPVSYRATAVDDSTADYTVTVIIAKSSAKAITAYSLAGVEGAINEATKIISVTMPFGTNVTALVATFTTTTAGASVKVGEIVQLSGLTENNFTNPVVYSVMDADGLRVDYTVTVTVALSSAKAITAYSLAGVEVPINEAAKSISVTMPFGTNVTALVATFTTTGVSVKVGETSQTSGQTANDFTNPVIYRLTAADGTTADYTVTVTVALSSAKAITAYSINGITGVINETTRNIAVLLPFGTNISFLAATFTTTGVSVKVGETIQTSGQTSNDFTNTVVYMVTAADGTIIYYTVTVAVALRSSKAITAYSLAGIEGEINETAKSIIVQMPFGTDVTALVATFTTTGVSVKAGGTVQVSGQTANDFTNTVVYTVTTKDGATANYTITVAVASRSSKAITAYSLAGVEGEINETAKSIIVRMPFGTNVTGLVSTSTNITGSVATFTTTGASVKIREIIQTSGQTANDFTNPVIYRVTAADGSIADYTVTVTVGLVSSKAITSYSLAGVEGEINETTKSITVQMPFGTNVTNLVATFTTTGASISVGSALQISTLTSNDFTNPVVYRVKAKDRTTVDYTVTVNVALVSSKALIAYSLAGVGGVINETTKSITVTMPFGTDLTSLVATFTTTGASVRAGDRVQVSGQTTNDFTNPVVYRITAADSTTVDYTVTVNVALRSSNSITLFSLNGTSGIINEAAKSISVTMPFGTNVTFLTATFTSTTAGPSVKVGQIIQLSGLTANNFTNPVVYRVTAADGSTADYTVTVTVLTIKLPKTGQTESYGVGDDGEIEKGVAWPNPRFTVGIADQADCVTDNLTGLMWVKSPDSITRTWQSALDYSNNLTLCGFSDWRLPNRKELRSMINYGEPNSASWLNAQGFINLKQDVVILGDDSYWSSNTYTGSTSYAWTRIIWSGSEGMSGKAALHLVWSVRSVNTTYSATADLPQTGQKSCYDSGGSAMGCASLGQDGDLQKGVPWPNPRFTPNGQTVRDNLTGLIWTRDGGTQTIGSCAGGKMTWQSALNYVACLNANNYLGYTDWRLPNVNELESLINIGQIDNNYWLNMQGFSNVTTGYYWSSTTSVSYPNYAFDIFMLSGSIGFGTKSPHVHGEVLPVRGGQ